MPIRRELIDELLQDYSDPQDILAKDGLFKQVTKAVIERCLETELDRHLGYPKHADEPQVLQALLPAFSPLHDIVGELPERYG